eukprot:UN03663
MNPFRFQLLLQILDSCYASYCLTSYCYASCCFACCHASYCFASFYCFASYCSFPCCFACYYRRIPYRSYHYFVMVFACLHARNLSMLRSETVSLAIAKRGAVSAIS